MPPHLLDNPLVVKKVLLLVLAGAVASLLAAARVAADPVWAGQCDIPAKQTVWADYSWPSLLPIMARPGTLVAVTTSGGDNPGDALADGAATYQFDLHLSNRVGTPSAPADASTIEAAAEKDYQSAVNVTFGCTTPLIVENELMGADSVTPWAAAYEQYRANVLALLEDLAALGAHPVLLVSNAPFTGSSDAVAWWLQVAQVADIVREVYIPAPQIWPLGPTVGNRVLRKRDRAAIADFTSIGIPASRLGIMLSFLSETGVGGRDGLEPASAWNQVVKWEALSAKEVAAETHLGSVFSWGWQEWNPAEVDANKPKAACVWLWARDSHLCNAPKMLGPHFDKSRTEGQLSLPSGVVCRVDGFGTIGAGEVAWLTSLTGDRNVALSAAFERLVEGAHASVSSRTVQAVENEVIATAFGGSRAAYLSALQAAHVQLGLARSVLADEVRRAKLEQELNVGHPSASRIEAFYAAYPDLSARRVRVSPSAPWMDGRAEGLVLSEDAPAQLFTLPSRQRANVQTLLGSYRVSALGAAVPLGSIRLDAARGAIVAALRDFARAQAFQSWTMTQQGAALAKTTCVQDQLPQPADVDLTQYLPFLLTH